MPRDDLAASVGDSSPTSALANATQAVRQGDIQVRITDVNIDYVQIKTFREGQSQDKLFVIRLEITNLSPSKIVNYKGWGTEAFSTHSEASLIDDVGNRYKKCHFGLGSRIIGQVAENESVYPHKNLTDIVVFEPPIDTCAFVILELPADSFGGEGKLRIKIPGGMWRHPSSHLPATKEAPEPKEPTQQVTPQSEAVPLTDEEIRLNRIVATVEESLRKQPANQGLDPSLLAEKARTEVDTIRQAYSLALQRIMAHQRTMPSTAFLTYLPKAKKQALARIALDHKMTTSLVQTIVDDGPNNRGWPRLPQPGSRSDKRF